ncbi:MAG: hypothetical protein EAZ11_11650 [Curvibacter sp.]|nr:MAG: hypothetical protein EAZ11_11650 [Curvibacter sp.]
MTRKVIVKRGNLIIEELGERPIRLLPDRNSAAVVYKKLAYPLRTVTASERGKLTTAYIDLEDVPTDKDETTFPRPGATFVLTGRANFIGLTQVASPFSPEPEVKWSTESTAYGHYLVFDGDQAFFGEVQKSFYSQGLSWLRADECYRPSKDGHMYDWFLRFERDDRSPEQFRAQVKAALGQVKASPGQAAAAMSAAPVDRLAVVTEQAEEQTLQLEKLIRALQESQVNTDRIAATKKAIEVSSLERQQEVLRRELEDAKYKLRKRDEEFGALQRKYDALSSQLRAQAEDYANMQRSHARLLRLLEEERSTNLRKWTASQGNEVASLRGELRAAYDRVSRVEAENESVRQSLQAERIVASRLQEQLGMVNGKLQPLESEISALTAKLEMAHAESEQWIDAHANLEEDYTKLHKAQIEIVQQSRAGGSGARQRFEDVGALVHHCLPRLSISSEAISEIVEEGWFRSAPELWRELKKLNDYKHGSGQDTQFAQRIVDNWHEIREHISDGKQSDRLRIYFEVPKVATQRKKVQIMWKQDKQQQQRLHDRLGASWSPFLKNESIH